MIDEKFIACGMYAFTDALQQAWQELFDHFRPRLDRNTRLRPALDFRHGETVLRDPGLLFGQTCGYPLMTRLRDSFTPFCVACFDVAGTDRQYYSSQLIVNADSEIESLQQCRGKLAAINSDDSNSGMNVLRYELARIGARPGFLGGVAATGSHRHSIEAVAVGRADLAAIDCVTFQLVADAHPQLVSRVRSIGLSASSCGLPFVLPGDNPPAALASQYTDALRQALSAVSPASRRRLHLAGFEAVTLDDYAGILKLENYAIEHGLASLN